MKRYQVFLENPDGSGKGQLYEAETLEQVWSWLDLTFSGDDVPRLWWVKDREEKMVATQVQTGKKWFNKFADPKKFTNHLREKNNGWLV